MEQKLRLNKSTGEITAFDKRSAEMKKKSERAQLTDSLPAALQMYSDGKRKERVFTKGHIMAILAAVFDAPIDKNSKKEKLLKELEKQVGDRPLLIEAALSTIQSVPPPPLPPVQVPPMPPLPPVQLPPRPRLPPVQPPPAAAAAAVNPNANWLYHSCARAKVTMGASQTPLEISAIIVKVLKEIERMGQENVDNALIIFDALKASSLHAQRSDYQFMNDVVDKVDNLINAMNEGCLTEEDLKKQQ